jgi:hypothetical protein
MQGFYFYRNERLIQAGGWNGILHDSEPHHSLARVRIDLPNALDELFGLNVQKSTIVTPEHFPEACKAAKSDSGILFRDYLRHANQLYRKKDKRAARETPLVPNQGISKALREAWKESFGLKQKRSLTALTLARQSGDHHGIASILQTMGTLARATGKAERARELIGEGLSLMQRIGCQHCSAAYLGDLALVADALGESERTVRLLGASEALRQRTGIVAPTAWAASIEKTSAQARHLLGEVAYATAWSEGLAMSLPQATAYALGQPPSAPPFS